MNAIPRSLLGAAVALGCWAASAWVFSVKVPGGASSLWTPAGILLGAGAALGLALGPVLASAEAARARGKLTEAACCLAWLAAATALLWWLGAPLPGLSGGSPHAGRLPAAVTLPTVLTVSITLIWLIRSAFSLAMIGAASLWRRARRAG